MGVLDSAKKMSNDEVMDKIITFSIQEYGLCHGFLGERMKAVLTESRKSGNASGVVCALNNADTHGVLLDLLKEHPRKVMDGISIAAYAMASSKKTLYIPEYAPKLMESLKELASEYQIELILGIVDVRACERDLLMHIVTACDLAEKFGGQSDDSIYVSVNGAPLKKISVEMKISQVTDCSKAKAILLGYRLYKPDVAELTLSEVGIENGVISVLTQKDCIVLEVGKKLMASRIQSCGKCVFCREGLLQLQYMNNEISVGKGKNEFPQIIKEIGTAMEYSTPCTMGQTSADIVLSAIELFESEYVAHIKKKKCSAGVCFSAEKVYIDPKLCVGCGDCMDECPQDCIEGRTGYIHMIDEFACTCCGKCVEVCEEKAVIKTSGKIPKLPNRLTKVGRFRAR